MDASTVAIFLASSAKAKIRVPAIRHRPFHAPLANLDVAARM
jgi:hypothetical protein